MKPALSTEIRRLALALKSALANLKEAKSYLADGLIDPGLLKASDAALLLNGGVLRSIKQDSGGAVHIKRVTSILTNFEFIAKKLDKNADYSGERKIVGRKITELQGVKRALKALQKSKMADLDDLFDRISDLPSHRLDELSTFVASLTPRSSNEVDAALPDAHAPRGGKLALVVSNDQREEAKPGPMPEVDSEWWSPTVTRVLTEWPNVSAELLNANLKTALDAVRLGRGVIVGTALRELSPAELDELKSHARSRQWRDRQRFGYAWEASPITFIQNQYSDWMRKGLRRAHLRAVDETLIKRLEKFETDHDITDSILPAQGSLNTVLSRELVVEAARAADRERKRRRRLETKDLS